MAATASLDFRAVGVDELKRALRSINQLAQEGARTTARLAKQGADTTKTTLRETERAAKAAAAKDKAFAKEMAATSRQVAKDRAAIARESVAVEKAAQREKTRASEAAAKADAKTAAEAAKIKVQAQRAVERETRAIKSREARESAQAKAQSLREEARTQRMFDQGAAQNFRARLREQDKMERAQRVAHVAENRSWKTGAIASAGSGAVAGTRTGMGLLAAGGAIAAGIGGGVPVMGAIDQAMQLELGNAQLAADVRTGNDKFIDTGELKKKQQLVASQTGISALEIQQAQSVASGQGGGLKGLEVFTSQLEKWGTIALATGTKMEDLASISATMSNNMIDSGEEQVKLMLAINAAAKAGNVNTREMAKTVMGVAGKHQALGFEGTSARRMMLSSAGIQLAKLGGAPSAEEAATSWNSFMADLSSTSAQSTKVYDAMGVKRFTKDAAGNKVYKDVETLTAEVFEKSGGDPEKLGKLFDIRSKAAQGVFAAAFKGENTDLRGADGSVLKGKDAIHALFAKMASAQQTEGQIGQEADLVRNQTATKLAIEMERFKATVGNDLLPVVTQLTPTFSELLKTVASGAKEMAPFVKWVSEHPKTAAASFLALNAAVGAASSAMTSLIGKAGEWTLDKLASKFGKVPSMSVSAGVVQVSGGAPGGGGTGSPVPAGMGVGGAATVAGAAAATAILAADGGIEDAGRMDKETADKAFQAMSMTGRLRSGKATAADRDIARAMADDLSDEAGSWDSASGVGRKGLAAGRRFIKGAVGGVTGLADTVTGKKEVSAMGVAEDVASLIPQLAALRGLVATATGGQNSSLAEAALIDLRAELAKPMKLDAAQTLTVSVNNWGDMPSDAKQRPAAQPP